jgi:glucose-1-phosphatase
MLHRMPTSPRGPGDDVRALLFDLGGVLMDIDFDRVLGAWSAAARCDPAELRARFCFDAAYRQHERGEIQAPEYFAALRDSLGLQLSDDEFLDGWGRLYAGVIEPVPALLAAAAKRFPLYAFTNSNPAHQAVWSARFAAGLECFRSVFVSCELGLRKPDAAAFAAVCQLMGARPDQVVFFDDTAENVTGAQQAGLRAVLVRSAADIQGTCALLGISPPR